MIRRWAASALHPPLAIRCLLWQMARRSGKSPLHARELARTMSAPPLPATSGLAVSKSATGSSTPRRRRRRCSAPRCDSGIKRVPRGNASGGASMNARSSGTTLHAVTALVRSRPIRRDRIRFLRSRQGRFRLSCREVAHVVLPWPGLVRSTGTRPYFRMPPPCRQPDKWSGRRQPLAPGIPKIGRILLD